MNGRVGMQSDIYFDTLNESMHQQYIGYRG